MSHPNRTSPSVTNHTEPPPHLDTESSYLLSSYTALRQTLSPSLIPPLSNPILPDASLLRSLTQCLPQSLPPAPLGNEATTSHLLTTILPSLNHQSLSPHYYGFVTGSVHPAAQFADNIVSALDQNVQVHLPAHSASTRIEDSALRMVISLLDLDQAQWKGRTFTTGATASNVVGLACAREAVIAQRLPPGPGKTVADLGLLRACLEAGIRDVQVLTSLGHSSLSKAASVVGLGRGSVKDVAREEEPWRLDLDALEQELKKEKEGIVSIIAVSAGEVNTGRFATGLLDMPKIRSLADRYGAWVHVDGAFGLFVRALPKTDEFLALHAGVAGMELADSIGADGHKLLNVPYDNGIFLCRHPSILSQVFSNPNAAYLASAAANDPDAILSPLNIGIENSRRFRALPVYAVLLSEGREGMAAMFSRMVKLSRRIAAFIRDSEQYEWLPSGDASLESTFIIVLFRAKDQALNNVLVDRINETRKIFVSGTSWGGKKAVRLAVSTWRVDVERDAAVVEKLLTAVAEGQPS